MKYKVVAGVIEVDSGEETVFADCEVVCVNDADVAHEIAKSLRTLYEEDDLRRYNEDV